MLSKVIFAFVFTLTSLVLGAEITLKQEANEAASSFDPDGESSMGSVADLATSNSDLSKSSEDTSSDEMDEWSTMTDAPVTENIAESPRRRRPGHMMRMRPMMNRMNLNARLDYTPPGEGRFQLINLIDRLRQADNHQETDVWPRLIDPHMMPQNQLVDSTLRLMAIKSSLDDLLASAFPNLRMLQRMFMDRQ